MIDFFFSYDSAGSAKTAYDALCTQLGLPVAPEYRSQSTINDVKVWKVSEDTVTGTPLQVVHVYLPGYWVLVAVPSQEQILLNDMALQFALDRDACTAGQPYIVANNVGVEINDYAHQPTFAGATYPMGGYH